MRDLLPASLVDAILLPLRLRTALLPTLLPNLLRNLLRALFRILDCAMFRAMFLLLIHLLPSLLRALLPTPRLVPFPTFVYVGLLNCILNPSYLGRRG